MVDLFVITVTYNSQETILKCVQSVNLQSDINIGHILIDGGSIDATVDIFKNNSKKIYYNISEKDLGIYDALNKAISILPVGSIFCILHSDDIFYDSTTCGSALKFFIDDPELDVLYGDLLYVSKSDRPLRKWVSGIFSVSKLKFGWMPPHPTLFIRKSDLTDIKYNLKYKISSDFDYIIKLFSNPNIHISYINKYITKMRIGGISNSGLYNIFRKSREDFLILSENVKFPIVALILKNLRKINQFKAIF